MKKTKKSKSDKKLSLKVATVRMLRADLTAEQLDGAAGGMKCTHSAGPSATITATDNC